MEKRNWKFEGPEIPVPKVDPHWREKYPEGSMVRLAEYDAERGWYWRDYRVIHYYPFIVHCIDDRGFNRGFGNWEFMKRQEGKMEGFQGTASRWEGERNIIESNLGRHDGPRKKFWAFE